MPTWPRTPARSRSPTPSQPPADRTVLIELGRPYTRHVSGDLSGRFTDVATVGVLAFVGTRLVTGLRRSLSGNGRATIRRIVSGIRWRHIWPIPFVLAAVILVASALVRIPGLDWGWWSALGGE